VGEVRGGEGAVFGCKKLKKILNFVSLDMVSGLPKYMKGAVRYG
jgi:hypothetical protein